MIDAQAAGYIAECFWADVHPEDVELRAERARRSAAELTREGRPVDFAGSIHVWREDVVFFLFDGVSAEAVREACVRAEIPFERIVESVRRASNDSHTTARRGR